MPWENSRPTHVPPRIRDACLNRDAHQCTAIMRDNTRCTETTKLEAAHLNQWQPSERITVDDVRTLCHWHHNRETQAQAAAARRKRGTARMPHEKHPGLR